MEDVARRVDVEKLISLGDDLVEVLKNKKDSDSLTQISEGAGALHSSWEVEFHEVQNSLEDYQKRIDACKQQLDKAKGKVCTDEELARLKSELEGEIQKERLLHEELRTISNEIGDLERQRISVEERRAVTKGKEKDLLRKQNMLSMCAQVTSIIPDLTDQANIAGYIVGRDKNVTKAFEFEPTLSSSSTETCHRLWKMIEP